MKIRRDVLLLAQRWLKLHQHVEEKLAHQVYERALLELCMIFGFREMKDFLANRTEYQEGKY